MDIADQVVEDIKKRKAFGRKKYGVPLRANNGRNALQDAYEEAQDMTLYLKQKLVEEEQETTIDLEYQLSLEVAAAVLGHYFKKTKWFKATPAKKKDILLQFPLWLEKEIKHGIS
jgi:hypothetical protein